MKKVEIRITEKKLKQQVWWLVLNRQIWMGIQSRRHLEHENQV